MLLPDVNILVNAFRVDSQFHDLCNRWLTSEIEQSAQFGLSPLALAAVVRVTTNTRSFAQASTLDEAFGFADYLLAQPNCHIVTPGARHWDIFRKLCLDTSTRGPRVTDAWYAALAIEWNCEWVTMDRDFARFPGLRWRSPSLP